MQQGDPDEYNDCMDEEFIFDSRDEFFDTSHGDDGGGGDVSGSPDVVDGVALGTPGSVPSYLVTALMHCPDQFDGARVEEPCHRSSSEAEAEAAEKEKEQDKVQNLLVLVADRKACETGWVLHLAINHKGQVLPFRIRDQAREVSTSVGNWMDSQALTENTLDPDQDVEYYMREGDGWE